MNYSLNWDLDSIFSGGSNSLALNERMTELESQMENYYQLVGNWEFTPEDFEQLQTILQLQAKISDGFTQCDSYITALLSANVNDSQAKILSGKLYALLPRLQSAETVLSTKFAKINEEHWQTLITNSNFQLLAFRLNELRRDGAQLLSESEENIINTLSLDGLNAWSSHYDTIVASIKIPFTQNGETVELSAGQAFNKMMSDPDQEIRKTLFVAWETAWKEKAPLFGDTLNHLDGFRLSTYKLHGITDYLQKPLEYNRLKKETLDVMW